MNRFSPFQPTRRLCTALIALLCALSLLLSCGNQAESGLTTAVTDPLTTIGTTTATVVETTTAPLPTTSVPHTEETTALLTTDSEVTTTLATTPATTPTTTPATTPTTTPATPPEPPKPSTEEIAQQKYASLSRNAAYVLLYDVTEGRILYTTGATQKIFPASTTKLLTLHYMLSLVGEDEIFTVGDEISIAPSDSSKAKIRKGEKYTCKDMVAALLLPSGNDAAYTIAAHCGRLLADDPALSNQNAVSRFMDGLNTYAASLGLTGTHFVTPDGYHDDAHITTLEDMLQITLLAKSHPLLAEVMATPTYKVTDLVGGRTMTWTNTNYLIQSDSQYYYPYATGGKTGFHTPAGSCLIATAQKDGRELIALIFKCSSNNTGKNARFADARNFLELGFSFQGPA